MLYHNARLLQILHTTPDAGPDALRSPEAAAVGELVSAPSARSLLSTFTEEALTLFEAALDRVLDEGIDRDVEVDFRVGFS